MRHYAALIPAFNEENTIRSVVEDTLPYCQHIIVVDDGSTDNTIAKIQDLPITILRNEKNCGKDASLLRGLSYGYSQAFNAVITLDADGQHKPEDIPLFLAAAQQYPHHIIIGARKIHQENAPRLRLFANRMADFFISWAAGKKIIDTQSGYRLYPADLISIINKKSSRYGKFLFESKVLMDATHYSYAPVAVLIESIYPNNARPSYFRPVVDTSRIVLMIFWKLLSRGFNPKGLWMALFKPPNYF